MLHNTMIKLMSTITSISLLSIFSFSTICLADYYVKTPAHGGSDLNAGTSWATAKATISAAISSVSSTDTVHVAAGTYTENISFVSNLTLLGGYPATGGDSQNPSIYETIIDGRGMGSVVTFNFNTSCTIDGFTLQNGNASSDGGGINCINSSATISNNRIINNTTPGGGGGIHIYRVTYTITGNSIAGNSTASGNSGGGIYLDYPDWDPGTCTISNNFIADNSTFNGGGIEVSSYGNILIDRNIFCS